MKGADLRMELLNLLMKLICLDIRSLLGVLVWGDLALFALAGGYQRFHKSVDDKNQIRKFSYTKLLQAMAWLLLFYRGDIPDFISIYFGNALLLISFYYESTIMLNRVKNVKPIFYTIQMVILGISLVLFLGTDFIFGKANMRVAVMSAGVFSLLFFPSFQYIFNQQSSRFKKYLGIYMLVFLCFLFLRMIQALSLSEITLFSSNFIQNGTYIALILIMVTNGAGFLLLIYEDTDDKLKKLAEQDSLTRLYNRRFFMKKGSAYFELHQFSGEPLTLLFIDIDHFKQVNDTYGHNFGDELLISLSRIMEKCVGEDGLCCRFGGEEYVILLRQKDAQQGIAVGACIQKTIETDQFSKHPDFKYTVSIGVYSASPGIKDTLLDFIDKSDQAMYQAKSNGRNQICVYETSKPPSADD